MKRFFTSDWKCCLLRFTAVVLTITTMIFTTAENYSYSYMLSLAAILFIGLSMRRAGKVTA